MAAAVGSYFTVEKRVEVSLTEGQRQRVNVVLGNLSFSCFNPGWEKEKIRSLGEKILRIIDGASRQGSQRQKIDELEAGVKSRSETLPFFYLDQLARLVDAVGRGDNGAPEIASQSFQNPETKLGFVVRGPKGCLIPENVNRVAAAANRLLALKKTHNLSVDSPPKEWKEYYDAQDKAAIELCRLCEEYGLEVFRTYDR